MRAHTSAAESLQALLLEHVLLGACKEPKYIFADYERHPGDKGTKVSQKAAYQNI